MYKKIRGVSCDICGDTESLRAIRSENGELGYTLPIGWRRGQREDVHLCKICAAHVRHRLLVDDDEQED